MMDEDAIPALVSIPNTPINYIDASLRKVPVTILTGFLGAGKSTLLGRILTEQHGSKIAVIMNELGPTASVDKATLWNRTQSVGEEWLEVENGCLCCTAKNETFLAIESLLTRRRDIERVVIEASGAADPASLVSKLWIDEALESSVVLDVVVCVVDVGSADNFLSDTSLHYSVEAARQVAIADCILLNKIDTVKPSAIEAAEKICRQINGGLATIIETSFSKYNTSIRGAL